MADPKESINIENVVASTGIGQELDLQRRRTSRGRLRPRTQFPGLVYRTQNPKSAALIFRSGKIVCTGAKKALTPSTRVSTSSSTNFANSRSRSKRTPRSSSRTSSAALISAATSI